jgi:uncharacterized protein (DUF885 family)
MVFSLLLWQAISWGASERNTLNALFTDYVNESSTFAPLAIQLEYDANYLPQLQFEYAPDRRQKHLKLEQAFLKKINTATLKPLSNEDKLNATVFAFHRAWLIESFQYPEHLLPIQSINNLTHLFPYLGSGQGAQPFNRIEDYEQWYTTMDQLPDYVDQLIQNLDQGIKQGVVFPKGTVQGMINSLSQFHVERVENSIYYRPVSEMPSFFIPNQKQYIILRYHKLISQKILPAYQKLENYLKFNYLAFASSNISISRVPSGAQWYQHLIRRYGSELPAADIHKMALEAVVKLRLQLEEVKQKLKYQGSLADLYTFVDSLEQEQVFDNEDLLNYFRSIAHRVNLGMPQLFSQFPRATYKVALAQSNDAKRHELVFYQLADYRNSTPGIFWVNSSLIKQHRRWKSESLFLQQGIPGAFFQASIEQDIENLPEFRKRWDEWAFREGWAIYAMSLGEELGLYKDPPNCPDILVFA